MVPGSRGEDRDLLSDELVAELLRATLIAKLATLDRDGLIHLVAMWFLHQDGRLFIPTSSTTRKIRNLERNPRSTVMIDDSRGGFDLRGVTLNGRAEILHGEAARELNRRVHLKYVTAKGLALAAVRDYLATDDVTIAFQPERVSSWDLRSTEQCRTLNEHGLQRPLD